MSKFSFQKHQVSMPRAGSVLWCVLRFTPQNTSSTMHGLNRIRLNGTCLSLYSGIHYVS